MVRGEGTVVNMELADETLRRSCLKMFWHRSVQFEQMYTSPGPSTMGPTSRLVLPQNEQVVILRPRKPESPPLPPAPPPPLGPPPPPWPPPVRLPWFRSFRFGGVAMKRSLSFFGRVPAREAGGGHGTQVVAATQYRRPAHP